MESPLAIERLLQTSVRSVQGTLNVPMPKTVFVHSSGSSGFGSDGSALDSAGLFYTSVNAAFAGVTASKGDRIVCLPGHVETVNAADFWSSIKAGVDIIGWGHGTLTPTLTWSTATATILLDVANVRVRNFRMYMEGNASGSALSVAAPITVSGASCGIFDCWMKVAEDADELATIAVTTTAAADDFEFRRNTMWGVTAGEVTTCLRVVGADRCKITDNNIQAATSSTTVGVVQFLTTASTFIQFDRNVCINNKALSVHAVTGMAGLIGSTFHNGYGILDNATTAGFETEGSVQFFDDHTANDAGAASVTKTPT